MIAGRAAMRVATMAKRKMLFHPDYVREKSEQVSLSIDSTSVPLGEISLTMTQPRAIARPE
jgi:hypothetical protein